MANAKKLFHRLYRRIRGASLVELTVVIAFLALIITTLLMPGGVVERVRQRWEAWRLNIVIRNFAYGTFTPVVKLDSEGNIVDLEDGGPTVGGPTYQALLQWAQTSVGAPMGSGGSVSASRTPALIDTCIAQANPDGGDPILLRCVSSDNPGAWSAASLSDLPAELQAAARDLINKNALSTGKSNLFSSLIFSPSRGADGRLLYEGVTGTTSMPNPTGTKGEPVIEEIDELIY